MKNTTKTSQRRGSLRKGNIITSILSSDLDGVKTALLDDPRCVNDVHDGSGMNAAMLAALSVMPTFLDAILQFGSYLDFRHCDIDGSDLLEVAMMSRDAEIVARVEEAYIAHAPHIVNNWPEP